MTFIEALFYVGIILKQERFLFKLLRFTVYRGRRK
jgi:hypothetical protein